MEDTISTKLSDFVLTHLGLSANLLGRSWIDEKAFQYFNPGLIREKVESQDP